MYMLIHNIHAKDLNPFNQTAYSQNCSAAKSRCGPTQTEYEMKFVNTVVVFPLEINKFS